MFSEVEKNRVMTKTTTDPDLQKFRKIDAETVQKISTIAASRRSSLDLADLNYMSKEVTAAKEVCAVKVAARSAKLLKVKSVMRSTPSGKLSLHCRRKEENKKE